MVEEESEKVDLKFNIKKNSDHGTWAITSRLIEGAKVETVIHFIFLGSRITADSDCSSKL